jgi:hypothetical protein
VGGGGTSGSSAIGWRVTLRFVNNLSAIKIREDKNGDAGTFIVFFHIGTKQKKTIVPWDSRSDVPLDCFSQVFRSVEKAEFEP